MFLRDFAADERNEDRPDVLAHVAIGKALYQRRIENGSWRCEEQLLEKLLEQGRKNLDALKSGK